MKLPQKPSHPFLAAFRALPVPDDLPAIRALRGNMNAPLLLLAEHPTEEDYFAEAPFVSDAAKCFCYLLHQADLDTDEHFLVMPFSRFGPKPNKASTEATLPFLRRYLDETNVKCVVTVGMEPFGFTFAGGRKTHSRSIIGNPMYLPYIGTRPVFVMPDTSLLLETSSADFRTARKANDKAQEVLNLAARLRTFAVEKLKLKI